MLGKQNSVISLDPIDRKKKKNWLERLFITQWSGGDSVRKTVKFGHYMFCGPQRAGKTSSALWFAERLAKKHKRRPLEYKDDTTGKFVRFTEPTTIKLWSNFGVGTHVNKEGLFKLIDEFDPYANEVRIIIIDEVHTYFPRGTQSKETALQVSQLTAVFSQLAKRNTYILSTAQVYGRLDKSMREQCLYMIDCRVNRRNRLVNEFILETDIIADELGRWAGNPQFIRVHGLSKMEYDTKRLIRE
ncbi:MAG: RecA/RadA recombinase [Circular genetic element sp.]|nr:MAG: RecA/RadA recombinase [Circular genetic element sp.]